MLIGLGLFNYAKNKFRHLDTSAWIIQRLFVLFTVVSIADNIWGLFD